MEERLTAGRVLRAILSAFFNHGCDGGRVSATLGPLLDHHYAERLPNHTHLYLGPGGPNHVHPFEVQDHFHYHPFDAPTERNRLPGVLRRQQPCDG